MGMGGQAPRPPVKGGKGKKGAQRRDQGGSNPFNPMGNTTKSTAVVVDPEVN
jgi:hypothetical protein